MNISIINARKIYENQEVLSIDRLEIHQGHIYALMGLNGSGKSTLLQCIAGLEKLTSGEILYDDSTKVEGVRRKLAVMLQEPYLFNESALDNIIVGLKHKRIDKKIISEEVKKLIKYFNMEYLLKKNVKKLSGGERERIALLRTIILDAEVTLLDEPTANMDIENTLKAEKIIRNLVKGKRSVILVTHDLFQAERIADYIVIMDNGKVIEAGEKTQVVLNQRENLLKRVKEGVL